MGKVYRTNLGTVLVAIILAVCFLAGIGIAIAVITQRASTEMPEISPIVSQREPAEMVDDEIEELLGESGFSSLTKEEKAEKTAETLSKLEDAGLVSECEYDEDQQLYYFTYQDGTWGAVDLNERTDETNGSVSVTQPTAFFDRADEMIYGTPCDIVILNGFENTPYRREYYETVLQQWCDVDGLDVQYDTNVTVEDMRHLVGYDVVVFAMHGTVMRRTPALVLNETASTQRDSAYARELKNHSIAKIATEDGTFYAVLPSFFDMTTYGEAGFNGTFFFSESCDFFGDDETSEQEDFSFAENLLGGQAAAVIGFRNSVYATYSRNVMASVVTSLQQGQTAAAALNAARDKYGEDDGRNAYPIICGEDGITVSGTTPATTPEPTAAPAVEEAVYNGQEFKIPEYERICPLTVSVQGTAGYYCYFAYRGAPEYSYSEREHDGLSGGSGNDLSFYVAPGETVEKMVPIGSYDFYWCTGETWYGVEEKFGADTVYCTTDEKMEFYTYTEGNCINTMGHTLQMWVQEGGNMKTDVISASSFPD